MNILIKSVLNVDGYSSEDDDMDDMVDGNGGDNIDKIGGARKGKHKKIAKIGIYICKKKL